MKNITQKDIYKACIVLSIIGLGIIHISHSYLEYQEVKIEEIDRTWLGNSVRVEGEIVSRTEVDGAKFMELKDSTDTVNIVDFEMRNTSDQASISGYVDVYQGDLQIVAEEIENK
jgi:RecJ-like exonuclease